MQKHIPKAHDHFFRDIMADKRVARDFFEAHLPAELLQAIDLDYLELLPESNIDSFRSESIADFVFKTKINGLDAFLDLIVDHQSTPDHLMSFRTEKYRCDIIAHYLKQNPHTKTIPLVVPIVLYHGKALWKHSTDVRTLINAPQYLIDTYGFKPFILIDLNTITDEVLKQHVWSGVMDLALKHIFARDILPHLKDMVSLFQQLDQTDGWSVVESVIKYVLDRGQMNKQEFITVIRQELPSDLGEKIMTVSEQLIAEGMQKGIQQGLHQGMHLAKLEDARAMLAAGLDIRLVTEITKLSLEEIESLNKDTQH